MVGRRKEEEGGKKRHSADAFPCIVGAQFPLRFEGSQSEPPPLHLWQDVGVNSTRGGLAVSQRVERQRSL